MRISDLLMMGPHPVKQSTVATRLSSCQGEAHLLAGYPRRRPCIVVMWNYASNSDESARIKLSEMDVEPFLPSSGHGGAGHGSLRFGRHRSHIDDPRDKWCKSRSSLRMYCKFQNMWLPALASAPHTGFWVGWLPTTASSQFLGFCQFVVSYIACIALNLSIKGVTNATQVHQRQAAHSL